jgi:hypothetical protein
MSEFSADLPDRLEAAWAAPVRRRFRTRFQPHHPYVFAKFRCVARS